MQGEEKPLCFSDAKGIDKLLQVGENYGFGGDFEAAAERYHFCDVIRASSDAGLVSFRIRLAETTLCALQNSWEFR